LDGNRGKMVGKIQQKYGIAKEEAENMQLGRFMLVISRAR
jgi:uncharacterized protein YjbJ (UPF0337 family)